MWGVENDSRFRIGEEVSFEQWVKKPDRKATKLSPYSLEGQALVLIDKQGCPIVDFVGLIDEPEYAPLLHVLFYTVTWMK
jgi:hypothetical protein